MIWFGTGSPKPIVYTDSATLKSRHFSVEQLLVASVASKTYTLPTPIKDLAGKPTWFVNNSTGSQTLSGAFVGGSSETVLTKTMICLMVLPVSPGVYKWFAFGITSVTAGLAEIVMDYVNTMFQAGSHTGMTITYDDALDKESIAVAYGAVGDIAALGALTNSTAAGAVAGKAANAGHIHGMVSHPHSGITDGGLIPWANIDKTTSSIANITTKSHTALTDIGTNTHAQIDTALGTTIPAYFNISTGHDHDGTDSKLLPIPSIVESVEWTTFTSTLVFTTATPTVTVVARYRRLGKSVEFLIDITTADGIDGVFVSATLPVVPKAIDAYVPVAYTKLINATYSTGKVIEIDAANATPSSRIIKARETIALTTGNACRLSLRGSYEVA